MRNAVVPFFVIAACLCSGCVAFNVGEPIVERRQKLLPTHLVPEVEEVGPPMLVNAKPIIETGSDWTFENTMVQIEIEGTFSKRHSFKAKMARWTETKQRRMSFGLFPGYAEWLLRTPGAQPLPNDVFGTLQFEMKLKSDPGMLPIMGFGWLLMTGIASGVSSVAIPYSTFVVPFYGDYEGPKEGIAAALYYVPFGFHRYECKTTSDWSDELVERRWSVTSESKRAEGPFRVRLTVPELSFDETQTVRSGETAAGFLLPLDRRRRSVSARIRFDRTSDVADEETKKILASVVAETDGFLEQIRLSAPPVSPKPRRTETIVVTNRIVERIERQLPLPPPATPYDIETIREFSGGSATYLVTVMDPSKTKPEIAKLAQSEIKGMLRDSFLAENPGTSAQTVRLYLLPTFNQGPTITMHGVAVSIKPVPRSWNYDPETKTGMLKLQILSHMDAETAKDWAARNIGAIVVDKGVAIEVGNRPPPGAIYSVLDDQLKDGILTIRFQVRN